MSKLISCSLLAILLFVTGCSQGYFGQARRAGEEGNWDRAIELYYMEIADNPESAQAWRELGAAFYKQGNLDKAEDALKQSHAIQPDARTHLYIGLIQEKRGEEEQAINTYGTALSLNPGGETERLIRAHVDHLIAGQMKREVDAALTGEGELDVAEIPENTIAVADFGIAGVRPDLAPLARGLAEFTAIDLAKVKELRVVDRLKIDVLLDELQLAETSAIDPASAPRMGRLLGSRRIVTGTVLGVGEDKLQVDGVIVDAVDSSTMRTETTESDLRRLFGMQKELVFRVIDDLGIELTPEERDAIAEVPTESFIAFMAFSRGIEYRQRGMLNEASASFNEALRADPGFGAAAAKAAAVEGAMALGGMDHSFGSFEQVVLSASSVGDVVGGVDVTLAGITANIGNLPDLSEFRQSEQPPVTRERATVIIRGDIND